jgi:hypothetical protein
MPVMPKQKPDPHRSRLAYALQLRLTKAQYAHLLVRAEEGEGGSMAAALRALIDESIDTTTVYNEGVPEDHPGAVAGGGGLWRSLLENTNLDALDPEALAAMLRDEE